MATKKTGKNAPAFSDHQKKLMALGGGSVAVVLAGLWAFYHFTSITPPDLKAPITEQKVTEMVEFLGSDRGLGRLGVDRQEQFMVDAYHAYGNQPEMRLKFARQMDQMTDRQREVVNNAIFEIGRKHIMESAQQYASLPPSQRGEFVDSALKNFEQMRKDLSPPGGGADGTGGGDLSKPLQKGVPTSSDEMMKVMADRTDAGERSKAKPFLDAMAAKYQDQKSHKNR